MRYIRVVRRQRVNVARNYLLFLRHLLKAASVNVRKVTLTQFFVPPA